MAVLTVYTLPTISWAFSTKKLSKEDIGILMGGAPLKTINYMYSDLNELEFELTQTLDDKGNYAVIEGAHYVLASKKRRGNTLIKTFVRDVWYDFNQEIFDVPIKQPVNVFSRALTTNIYKQFPDFDFKDDKLLNEVNEVFNNNIKDLELRDTSPLNGIFQTSDSDTFRTNTIQVNEDGTVYTSTNPINKMWIKTDPIFEIVKRTPLCERLRYNPIESQWETRGELGYALTFNSSQSVFILPNGLIMLLPFYSEKSEDYTTVDGYQEYLPNGVFRSVAADFLELYPDWSLYYKGDVITLPSAFLGRKLSDIYIPVSGKYFMVGFKLNDGLLLGDESIESNLDYNKVNNYMLGNESVFNITGDTKFLNLYYTGKGFTVVNRKKGMIDLGYKIPSNTDSYSLWWANNGALIEAEQKKNKLNRNSATLLGLTSVVLGAGAGLLTPVVIGMGQMIKAQTTYKSNTIMLEASVEQAQQSNQAVVFDGANEGTYYLAKMDMLMRKKYAEYGTPQKLYTSGTNVEINGSSVKIFDALVLWKSPKPLSSDIIKLVGYDVSFCRTNSLEYIDIKGFKVSEMYINDMSGELFEVVDEIKEVIKHIWREGWNY